MKLTERITDCMTLPELESELNRAAQLFSRIKHLPEYENTAFWRFLEIDPQDLCDRVLPLDFPFRPDCVVDSTSSRNPHWIAWGREGLLIEDTDNDGDLYYYTKPWDQILEQLSRDLVDYEHTYSEEQIEATRTFVAEVRTYLGPIVRVRDLIGGEVYETREVVWTIGDSHGATPRNNAMDRETADEHGYNNPGQCSDREPWGWDADAEVFWPVEILTDSE